MLGCWVVCVVLPKISCIVQLGCYLSLSFFLSADTLLLFFATYNLLSILSLILSLVLLSRLCLTFP